MFHLYPSHPSSLNSPHHHHHHHPHRPQSQSLDFQLPSSQQSAYSYEDYDLQRSLAEHEALARRQVQRRQAEETLLRRRQQELAIEQALKEREALEERRKAAAYEAALRQVAEARERQRVAELVERKREYIRQQQRKHSEEQEAYRYQVEVQRALARKAQLQAARERQAQIQHQSQTQEEAQGEVNPIEFFLKLFLSQHNATAEPEASQSPAPSVPIASTSQSKADSTTFSQEQASPSPAAADPEAVSAAATLQRHFRAHQLRRENLTKIASIASSLDSHQSHVVLPEHLTFRPSPPSSVNGDATASPSTEVLDATPQLAYSPNNSPFLAHEDFLVGLLSKIDAIESNGDKVVKKARKELVKKIEAELTKLDTLKDDEWKKSGGSENGEASVVAVDKKNLDEDQVAQVSEAEVVEAEAADTTSPSDDEDADLPPLIAADEPTTRIATATPPSDTSSTDVIPPVESSSSPISDLLEDPSSVQEKSAPLNEESVAALSTSTPLAARPAPDSDSDSSSAHTLSDEAELDQAVDEVLNAARKLGDQVVALEYAELPQTHEEKKVKEVKANDVGYETDSEDSEKEDHHEAEHEGFVVV